MYGFIVRQVIRRGFRDLSQGNYEAVLKLFSPTVHFVFPGTHALGADFHDVQMVRQWFQRFMHLFPGLQLEPQIILVNGWPWNTVVANFFTLRTTLKDGRSYHNAGVQFVRLRWGRVVEDYLYEDTQKLADELQHQAQQGIQEAIAAPLA
jgi:ketosteroid isomerase-like protein